MLLYLCCYTLLCTGCLPLLIQLLHGSGPGAGGLFGSMRGCTAARVRASQALRNIVTSNPDSRRSRREERVLQLLEQIRAYCDSVAADSDSDDVEQRDNDMAGVHQGLLWLISIDPNFFSDLSSHHY